MIYIYNTQKYIIFYFIIVLYLTIHHNCFQLVAQTAQKLSEVRQEIQPLADKIKPVKEEFQVVQQQYEQKKRVYEATSINITSQMEPLKNKVKELTDQLNGKEDEWKNLRQKIAKAESLQEVVMFEMKNSMQSPRKPSKMEELKKKVTDIEQIVKNLEEVKVLTDNFSFIDYFLIKMTN